MTGRIRRIAGNRAVTRPGAVARAVEDTSIKVKCTFCEGTGIQPHSPHRLTCSACGGKGVVTAIEDSITCPTCEGSGITMAPLPVACLTCNGQGVIRRRE